MMMTVIDAHAHMYKNPRDLDRMVRSGIIEQAWIMDTSYMRDEDNPDGYASHEEMLAAAREYKGFFIPFGFLDFRKGPDVVDELYGKGFLGLKVISPPRAYDDPSYFAHYERVQELGMPMLFHTGSISQHTREEMGEELSLSGTTMRPSMLQAIAVAFPRATLIGAHLGWPWPDEAKACISENDNIFYDFSGGNFEYCARWILENMDLRCDHGQYFTDKLIFAVDATYGREKIHDDMFRAITFWQLFFRMIGERHHWGEPSEVAKIMRGNAGKIRFPDNPNL